MATIVMAGGGTGGHVVPLLAVARELKARGHQCVFIGTRTGFEAKMVPAAGFPLEFIEIGGLKRVGAVRTIRTLAQLPLSVLKVLRMLNNHQPAAVFSLGGYAAGPVVLATLRKRLPLVVMEPNAMPGLTNRQIGRFVSRALLSFP
jgi:UDP-N-acetylglucosamine--N-acetylmuramyl-(pentapeptide) pyrophosphoryl-undecaprenol N-acetylglucosamine transferase